MNANYLRRRGVMSSPHVAEAHGSIASFDSDYCARLKDLTINIEPVQDLHGYSNPWPAGGGANKWNQANVSDGNNYTFSNDVGTQGTSYGSGGRVILYSGALSFPTGTTVTFSADVKISQDGENTSKTVRLGTRNAYQSGSFSHAHDVTLTAWDTYERVTNTFEVGETETTTLFFGVMPRYDGHTVTFKNIQVEVGSSATSWSPYANICPITGWTGANVYRTGVNVWDEEWELGYWANGVKDVSSQNVRCKNYIPVKPNTTYYVKYPDANGARLQALDADKHFISDLGYKANATFTTPSNCYYIVFYTNAASLITTYNHDISINYPSTDTSYHSYSGTVIPISWQTEAGTVYGGTVDVSSGVLTAETTFLELDGTETGWTKYSTQTCYNSTLMQNTLNQSTPIKGICSHCPSVNGDIDTNWLAHVNQYTGLEFRNLIDKWGLPNNEVATWTGYLAAQKTAGTPVQVMAYLKTPVTYQLTATELKTLLGQNNIFCNTGDTTVEYWKWLPE